MGKYAAVNTIVITQWYAGIVSLCNTPFCMFVLFFFFYIFTFIIIMDYMVVRASKLQCLMRYTNKSVIHV